MPLRYTTYKGKAAVKWGESGKPYTYKKGSKSSIRRAKKRALRQARAIKANS
jgi:hypothetical protein